MQQIRPKSSETCPGNHETQEKIKYKDIIKDIPEPKKTGCRCGEILRGLIQPKECFMYKRVCNPEKPHI